MKKLPIALAIFFAVAGVYGLSAWKRILEPSPHFHFTDLAWSLMHGRLSTDTPRENRFRKPKEDDPKGYHDAIMRALLDERGQPQGWNDWASYRVLTLKGGETVKGVWPWKDQAGQKRHDFQTLDGASMVIDPETDIAKGCGGKPWKKCDETVYYISFPPFPAVLMMPFVAIWEYATNDVLLTVLFAAISAVLMWLMLCQLAERGYSDRSARERLVLVALFAFGTVAWFSSIRGEVWFTALVVGLMLNTAYLMASLDARHPLLAGLFLALGFATRTPLLFTAPLFAMQLFWPASGERRAMPEIVKKAALFALPCLAVGIALMVYNEARFERAGEFGHTYLVEGTRESIRKHGLFSFWFLNRNLSAMITNMPVLTLSWPYVHITRHGLGLIAATPVFLFLLWPSPKNARLWRALVVAVLCTAVPAAFYQNTGWSQFAYRFSLDWTPYLFAMLAVDRRKMGRLYLILVGVAILVNLFGAITFGRAPGFYYD